MRRPCVGVLLVGVLLAGSGSQGHHLASSASISPNDIVAYVDNEVVDLLWDKVPYAQEYRLYRKEDTIGMRLSPDEIPGEQLFERVWAKTPGEDEEYRVCAVMADDSEECSTLQIVHHEWVEGVLHKDRTWQSAVYELDGTVKLSCAILTITDGATVGSQGSPSSPPIIEGGPGISKLEVGGGETVTIEDISIKDGSESSCVAELKGEEGHPVKLRDVEVDVSGLTCIDHCELTHSSVTINPGSGYTTISHNTFEDTSIEVHGGAVGVLTNTFSATSHFREPFIRLRDWADADIKNNTMTGSYIDVGGSNASIEGNRGSLGVNVWPDTGGTVTIENNRSVGFSSSSYLVDPIPPATGKGPPAVTIDGNILRSAHIQDDINVEVRNNTLAGGAYGIWCTAEGNLGRILIHNNCIVGHYDYGLKGPAGVDASGNWWGSSKGPTHPDNPKGDGDEVEGEVKYAPFLTKDNCDPSVRNLFPCWAEACQTVCTSDASIPLIAGKPAVVRAHAASATGQMGGVTGELTVRRGDTLVGTVQAERPVSTMGGLTDCPPHTYEAGLNELKADRRAR